MAKVVNKGVVTELDLTVVGMGYRMKSEQIEELAKRIYKDQEVIKCRLVLQPENEHDPLAVMVMVKGKHIGYVARPANKSMFELIRRGAIIERCELVSVFGEDGSGDLYLRIRKPLKNG